MAHFITMYMEEPLAVLLPHAIAPPGKAELAAKDISQRLDLRPPRVQRRKVTHDRHQVDGRLGDNAWYRCRPDMFDPHERLPDCTGQPGGFRCCLHRPRRIMWDEFNLAAVAGEGIGHGHPPWKKS